MGLSSESSLGLRLLLNTTVVLSKTWDNWIKSLRIQTRDSRGKPLATSLILCTPHHQSHPGSPADHPCSVLCSWGRRRHFQVSHTLFLLLSSFTKSSKKGNYRKKSITHVCCFLSSKCISSLLISFANLSICLYWCLERGDRNDNSSGKTTESQHCVLRPVTTQGSVGITWGEVL